MCGARFETVARRATRRLRCDDRRLHRFRCLRPRLSRSDRETYRVTYNPAHRWFYVPEMQADEAILIKCYDSALDKARFTAHSAFEDPTSPADVLPRESIELRTLVFHV